MAECGALCALSGVLGEMRIWKVSIAVFVVAVVILAAGSLIVLVKLSLSVSRDAETTLAAYRLVLEVLGDYAKKNGGRWPKSWDDLLDVPNNGCFGIRWPEDVAKVKKRIRINFDLTTDDVLTMDYDHFTAVEQTELNYGPNPWLIAKLLEEIRQAAGQIEGPPAA